MKILRKAVVTNFEDRRLSSGHPNVPRRRPCPTPRGRGKHGKEKTRSTAGFFFSVYLPSLT